MQRSGELLRQGAAEAVRHLRERRAERHSRAHGDRQDIEEVRQVPVELFTTLTSGAGQTGQGHDQHRRRTEGQSGNVGLREEQDDGRAEDQGPDDELLQNRVDRRVLRAPGQVNPPLQPSQPSQRKGASHCRQEPACQPRQRAFTLRPGPLTSFEKHHVVEVETIDRI